MIALNWSSFCLLLIFSLITSIIFQQTSSTVLNNNKNWKLFQKNIRDDFRCSENWFQMNYSCYFYPPEHISTSTQVNSTCENLHLDKPHLMFIEKSIELIYASYILMKNDLDSLLVQIDKNFIKNENWEKIFSSEIIDTQWKLFEEQTQPSKPEKNSSILKHCDEFHWNVINEDLDVLILNQITESNRVICSLKNLDSKRAYHHLCEYQLDHCLNNDKCGQHGSCLNTKTNFTCECSWFIEGDFCQKTSWNNIQLAIGICITLICPIDILIKLLWYLKRKACKSKDDDDDDKVAEEATDQNNEDDKSKISNKFILLFKQCHIFIYEHRLVIILSIFFTGILITIPSIHYFILSNKNSIQSNLIEIVNPDQHKRLFTLGNIISFIVSLLLTVGMVIFNRKYPQKSNNNQLMIIEPIKPFDITNRWKTTGIHLILTFEILEVLDETSIEIRDAIEYGIFVKLVIRLFFVFSIGVRYYPMLISLHFKCFSIRLITVFYSLANLIRIIIDDNLHLHYLLFFNRISSFNNNDDDDVDQQIIYEFSFIYYLIKRCFYYCSVGFTCSILIQRLRGNSNEELDEYSLKPIQRQTINSQGNNQNSNEEKNEDCWSNIRRTLIDQLIKLNEFRKKVYIWEEDFRLTTIVLCTYAIAFVFLLNLTFSLMFSYTLNQSIYVYSSIKFIERLLQTEIPKQTFRTGIILSAFITMIIFAVQLIHSIQIYKNSVRKTYENYERDSKELKFYIEKNQTIQKAIHYPALILRYLFGGILICFHLLLFFWIFFKTIFMQTQLLQRSILISIFSIICLYRLHKMIIRIVNSVFICFYSTDHDRVNIKSPNSILIYFDIISTFLIGVVSSVNRLIQSLLINILFLSRLDYSPFAKPLQSIDSVHMAFQCFTHWEILHKNEVLLDKVSSKNSTLTPIDNLNEHSNEVESPSDDNPENAPLLPNGIQDRLQADVPDTNNNSADQTIDHAINP